MYFRALGARGFEFLGSGARGFVFLDFERQRVRVFCWRTPKGSSFRRGAREGTTSGSRFEKLRPPKKCLQRSFSQYKNVSFEQHHDQLTGFDDPRRLRSKKD